MCGVFSTEATVEADLVRTSGTSVGGGVVVFNPTEQFSGIQLSPPTVCLGVPPHPTAQGLGPTKLPPLRMPISSQGALCF